MIELSVLRSFVAVAESGSYTRAAASLFLAPSTVYKHVRQLERAHAYRLMVQDGKRVRLTEEGRIAYEYGQRLGSLAGEFDEAMSGTRALREGSLAIGATEYSGECLLPRVCALFQRRYPGVRVRVTILPGEPHIDALLRERAIDVGLHPDINPSDAITKQR